jgi:hypothetical protein
MCSSNHWNTSHWADKTSQSRMSGWFAAVRYTQWVEGAPGCGGLQVVEEDPPEEEEEEHWSGQEEGEDGREEGP